MNDEPFFYTAGVVVPRDVTRLVIDGVAVVEAGTFRGYENLVWVEIREGVLTIGREAFCGCRNLERVDSPSSLRTIHNCAFFGCSSLSNMNLPEGLRRIGWRAFWHHSFEQITIPSSVVEIESMAFAGESTAFSGVLRKVTLSGGMVMTGSDAFFGYGRLRNMATPSDVIVVENVESGSGWAAVNTGGTIALRREREPSRLILASPYLASMKSEDVTRAKDAINRAIGGRPRREGPLDELIGAPFLDLMAAHRREIPPGEGPLNFTAEGRADRIRARFLGLLSAHRREITSVLELALWESSEGVGVEPLLAGIISSFLPDVEG